MINDDYEIRTLEVALDEATRPHNAKAAVEANRAQVDTVNHPPHYKAHPSGVECIEITEHMNFCLGNAIKYIWRAGEKGDFEADIKKAIWYLERELARVNEAAPV